MTGTSLKNRWGRYVTYIPCNPRLVFSRRGAGVTVLDIPYTINYARGNWIMISRFLEVRSGEVRVTPPVVTYRVGTIPSYINILRNIWENKEEGSATYNIPGRRLNKNKHVCKQSRYLLTSAYLYIIKISTIRAELTTPPNEIQIKPHYHCPTNLLSLTSCLFSRDRDHDRDLGTCDTALPNFTHHPSTSLT